MRLTPAPPGVRILFKASLLIFVVTIVIGILNGLDVWEPSRHTLLTHVHAGTLGWLTLAVFGAAIWMFGSPDDESSRNMATFAVLALSIYIAAFWSVEIVESGIQRPIGGTLAFIAMTWVFVWVLRRMRGNPWNVAELGMGLALGFLVLGAVLGVLLGLQLADVEIVDPSNADQLYDSHPGAMVAGFVILAGLAMIEWLMPGRAVPTVRQSRTGMVQMLLLFTAGLLFVTGALIDVEELLQAAGSLQLLGALFLIGRFRRQLMPSQWGGPAVNAYVRTALVGMVISVGLILYLIGEISGGKEFEEVLNVALAFDHINFIMVITNLVLAMMILSSDIAERVNRIVYWGVNVGIVGFAIGLVAESPTIKRIFTPILGLTLLYAIYNHFIANPVEGTPVRSDTSPAMSD